ncbi:hypothetical protein [Streptomyces hokutonensis]|uniref:DUF5666 domain-containing protein n=1 Tax=Streptomyces hokutonensis TaxID=1306990 RepID=A0ABW6MG59_9ACTN
MDNHDLLSRRGVWIMAAGPAIAVAGAGLGSTSAVADSASPAPAAATSPAPTPTGPEGGGPQADPSDGGATGIVDTTSASGFTMTKATGVKVTVTESSATKTTKTTGAPAKAVRKGASVLVLGTVDSATVAATRVVVQRGGDGGAAAAAAAGVIAFQQGTPSPDKSVGRIPDYTEGEGTIVNGTTAYKAIKAAQAVVPGGVNDRVVELSDGEYEVHNISVNWPHHVFVDKNFKVVGWE